MTNKELLDIAKPGSIILFKKITFIDECIRMAQALKNMNRSEWSHCAIKTSDNTLLESDFFFSIKGFKLFNGAMESPVHKYYSSKKVSNLVSLELRLNNAMIKKIIEIGRKLIKENVKYNIAGLLGTLYNITKWKLLPGESRKQRIVREQNIFSQDNTMYCVHYVLTCFKSAGIDLLPKINPSVATVEDLYNIKLPLSMIIKKKIGY